MLSLSAADEAELERWRTMMGRCQLPDEKRRPVVGRPQAIERLPRAMGIILRDKLAAQGALGPLRLDAREVADVEALDKIGRQEIVLHLLDMASAMAETSEPGGAIGAVAEGQSGSFYIGANIEWKGAGIKFSIHGAQAAVLSAWNCGETKLNGLMVEVQPCACCRQFLREIKNWADMKIAIAEGLGLPAMRSVHEIGLNLKGLRTDGLVGRLLGEAKQVPVIVSQWDLPKLAAASALASYAPYTRNYAGVALQTRRGAIHRGRYAETRESIAGVLAIESALTDLVLCGGQIADIEEIVLVESKGVVTQFAATQQLATRMGNIPFRFTMAKAAAS